MGFELQNRLSLKVLFNGEEFPFNRANSLEFLHMSSSTRIGVPMLHMAVQDNLDFLANSKHMADAARIQLVIAPRMGTSKTYVFRLNSYKRAPKAGGHRYELDGYLDASTYWHSSRVEPINGTSYTVLSKIASTCGLGFAGDQTTDTQLWIPRNTRYHEWARMISERGFRSDTSCMQLGLNFDKSLVYRDLTEERARSLVFKFGGYQSGTVLATDVVPSTNSGSMNHFSGYGDSLIEQDLEHAGGFKVNSQVTVAKGGSGQSLLVNSKVKAAAKSSKVSFAPIDCGNAHTQYEKALYQNRRINNLYSSQLSLLTPENTDLKLLDRVTVTLDTSTEYLKAHSGDYTVAARVIRVQGLEYYEKLELLRKSVNNQLTDAA